MHKLVEVILNLKWRRVIEKNNEKLPFNRILKWKYRRTYKKSLKSEILKWYMQLLNDKKKEIFGYLNVHTNKTWKNDFKEVLKKRKIRDIMDTF